MLAHSVGHHLRAHHSSLPILSESADAESKHRASKGYGSLSDGTGALHQKAIAIGLFDPNQFEKDFQR